ncbi:MAG: hypothetical protein SFY68_12405 [Candidatus Sumerlaeia bacterium]|nr:hypothetical protein [Candidatus Sumerlaeia bacterium]
MSPADSPLPTVAPRRRWRLPFLPTLGVMILLWIGLVFYLEANAKREFEASFAGLATCKSVDLQIFRGKILFQNVVFRSPLQGPPDVPLATMESLSLHNLWSASLFGDGVIEFETRNLVLNIVKDNEGRLSINEFDRVVEAWKDEQDRLKKKDEDDGNEDDEEEDDEEIFTLPSWALQNARIRLWRLSPQGGDIWNVMELSWDRLALQNLTNDPANTLPSGLQLTGLQLHPLPDTSGKIVAGAQLTNPAKHPTEATALLSLPALQLTWRTTPGKRPTDTIELLRAFQPHLALGPPGTPTSAKNLELFFKGFFEEPDSVKSEEELEEEAEAREEEAQAEAETPDAPRTVWNAVEVRGATVHFQRPEPELPLTWNPIDVRVQWNPGTRQFVEVLAKDPETSQSLRVKLEGVQSPWASPEGRWSLLAETRDFPLGDVITHLDAHPADPSFPRLLAGTLHSRLELDLAPGLTTGTVELELTGVELTPDRRSLMDRLKPAGVGGLVRSLLPAENATNIGPLGGPIRVEGETPNPALLLLAVEEALRPGSAGDHSDRQAPAWHQSP